MYVASSAPVIVTLAEFTAGSVSGKGNLSNLKYISALPPEGTAAVKVTVPPLGIVIG